MRAEEKIMSLVVPSWAVHVSPPSVCAAAVGPSMTQVIRRSPGSESSSGVTTAGPKGPNAGNDLPRLNCGAGGRRCTVRSLKS